VLYGRAGDASSGEGIAVMRVKLDVDDAVAEGDAKGLEKAEDGPFAYVIVTYRLQILSPVAVAALLACGGPLRPLLAQCCNARESCQNLSGSKGMYGSRPIHFG
jgi:hypothetical protein